MTFDPAAKTMSLQGTCARPSENAGYTVDTGGGGVTRLHELLGAGSGPVTEYVLTLR